MAESTKRKSKINTWKPKEYQKIVEKDGKLFICHFDRLFGHKEKLSVYEKFVIGKESYINQLDIITQYTNFFINNYDFDDELVSAYLKVKFALDRDHLFDENNMRSYISFLYEIMFTDTMVEKIIRLVEENYLDDIETTDDDKKKYLKNNKKHLESLEFTNQHIKILLEISFGMKIMSPALFHYIQKNKIKIEKDSEIIFYFYENLFHLFGYSDTYNMYDEAGNTVSEEIEKEIVENFIRDNKIRPTYDKDGEKLYWFTDKEGELFYYKKNQINLYNKLYVYVKAKVLEAYANNSTIFSQREIFGTDVYSVVNQFTKKVLISENVVKYKFNEIWDPKLKKYKENIIGFNKTIIKFQLNYFLKEQYATNLAEVTNVKNSEGLSGSDKMMMNATKIDEGSIVIADLNIKFTIDRIKKQIDVPISDEEIDFYMEHHNPSKIQTQLVYAYYTKYFGSYRDLNLLTKRDYITLLILLKKKLLIELGYEKDEQGVIHCASLPYLLCGNLTDKVNTRIIRNNRFTNKVKDDYLYKNLMENKYYLLECIKPDFIMSLLSSLINTRFTYVTYEYPELLGTEILYSEDKISDECLFFLNSL